MIPYPAYEPICPYYVGPLNEIGAVEKSIKEVRSVTAGPYPPLPTLSPEIVEIARSCPRCLEILFWPHEDHLLPGTCGRMSLLGSGKRGEDQDGRIGGCGAHIPSQTHQKYIYRTSRVAQGLRIRLPMQGTRVRALVREDPTCRGATKPVCHNY